MSAAEAAHLFDFKSELVEEDSENRASSPPAGSNVSSTAKVKVYSFVVKTKDGYSRTFRCSKEEERERWIEAITMTIAQIQFEAEQRASTPPGQTSPALSRKESISNVDYAPVGSPFKVRVRHKRIDDSYMRAMDEQSKTSRYK